MTYFQARFTQGETAKGQLLLDLFYYEKGRNTFSGGGRKIVVLRVLHDCSGVGMIINRKVVGNTPVKRVVGFLVCRDGTRSKGTKGNINPRGWPSPAARAQKITRLHWG